MPLPPLPPLLAGKAFSVSLARYSQARCLVKGRCYCSLSCYFTILSTIKAATAKYEQDSTAVVMDSLNFPALFQRCILSYEWDFLISKLYSIIFLRISQFSSGFYAFWISRPFCVFNYLDQFTINNQKKARENSKCQWILVFLILPRFCSRRPWRPCWNCSRPLMRQDI